jgi:hypothetical protein
LFYFQHCYDWLVFFYSWSEGMADTIMLHVYNGIWKLTEKVLKCTKRTLQIWYWFSSGVWDVKSRPPVAEQNRRFT